MVIQGEVIEDAQTLGTLIKRIDEIATGQASVHTRQGIAQALMMRALEDIAPHKLREHIVNYDKSLQED